MQDDAQALPCSSLDAALAVDDVASGDDDDACSSDAHVLMRLVGGASNTAAEPASHGGRDDSSPMGGRVMVMAVAFCFVADPCTVPLLDPAALGGT